MRGEEGELREIGLSNRKVPTRNSPFSLFFFFSLHSQSLSQFLTCSMATFNTPIHNLRPPAPSYSDQGDESCDEVDEGLYEADEQASDGEEEKGPEIEREMMHQQEEAVRKQEEQKKGKGKAKEEELDEEMVIIEPERMVDALPRSTRVSNNYCTYPLKHH